MGKLRIKLKTETEAVLAKRKVHTKERESKINAREQQEEKLLRTVCAEYILKNGSIFKVGNIHYLQVKGYLFLFNSHLYIFYYYFSCEIASIFRFAIQQHLLNA